MKLALKLVVAALLLVAGGLKLMDPHAFIFALANYRLLPEVLLGPVAYGIPVLEVLVAFALFHPAYEDAAWLLSAGMFLGFALAVGSAVVRGLDISCGCFGAAMTVSWYHLAGNLLAAGGSIWAYFKPSPSTASP